VRLTGHDALFTASVEYGKHLDVVYEHSQRHPPPRLVRFPPGPLPPPPPANNRPLVRLRVSTCLFLFLLASLTDENPLASPSFVWQQTSAPSVSPTRRPISSGPHRPPSPSRSIVSRHSQQEPAEEPPSTFSFAAESRADASNADAPAARYARLKQRNLAQHTGPGTIVSPPKPNSITYRDTTVNVASAFNQAAEDYTMSNTNGTYTSTTMSRRALPGPPPSRARKPLSKKAPNDEDVDEDGRTRGKSPLPEIASAFVRAVSPGVQAITTYVLRQKPTDEEESQTGFQSFALPPSNKPRSQAALQATQSGTSHAISNLSQEYNYSREESLANRMDSSTDKTVVRRRPRHSVNADNKAYKPKKDEEFSEDDYSTDDGRGGRRKKLKPVQKKALNLPSLGGMVGHSKRKSTSRKRKGAEGEEEVSDNETPVRTAHLDP
jgi:hypothetical protein